MSHSLTPGPVYLIDASIYIFRAHFSPYVECHDENGKDLSALYGFMSFLFQFMRRVQPSHVAIAHDASLFCGFRHKLCGNYKSNRELPDENLEMQLTGCSEFCSIIGLASFVSKVYEGDDIIGTIANRVRAESDCDVHIISRDKDLVQLLQKEADCLWDYGNNRKRFRANVVDEFGIVPEQFPDYLGLSGDSVDCISGIPGVGPVKAKELLNRFSSLEAIYGNLDKVRDLPIRGAGRLTELLREHCELAKLSKVLATIICNVEDPEESFGHVVLEELKPEQMNKGLFGDFLKNYKFRTRDREWLMTLAHRVRKR